MGAGRRERTVCCSLCSGAKEEGDGEEEKEEEGRGEAGERESCSWDETFSERTMPKAVTCK